MGHRHTHAGRHSMPPRPASSFRVDLPRFAGSVVGLPIVDRIGELCREINSCCVQPNSSASSEMRHTRMSRSFGSTVPSRVRAANPCVSFVDAAPNFVCDTDVGFGSKSEVGSLDQHVRSIPDSRHRSADRSGPFRAKSGRSRIPFNPDPDCFGQDLHPEELPPSSLAPRSSRGHRYSVCQLTVRDRDQHRSTTIHQPHT
jgi:hypothetical protein